MSPDALSSGEEKRQEGGGEGTDDTSYAGDIPPSRRERLPQSVV